MQVSDTTSPSSVQRVVSTYKTSECNIYNTDSTQTGILITTQEVVAKYKLCYRIKQWMQGVVDTGPYGIITLFPTCLFHIGSNLCNLVHFE